MKRFLSKYPQFKNACLFVGCILLEFWCVLSLSYKRYWGVILMVTTILALFLIFKKINKEEKQDKKGTLLAQLILNIKGEAGSWIGILTVIFVVINLNIISNLIWETKDSINSLSVNFSIPKFDQIDWWMLNKWGILFTQIISIILFLILPTVLFPISSNRISNNPKVLICGFSLLVDSFNDIKNEILIKKKLASININANFPDSFFKDSPAISSPKKFELFNFEKSSPCWGKWNVIRYSLDEHKNIQKIILVASKEILEFNKTIDQLIQEDNTGYFKNFRIENLISDYYPDRKIEVIYSDPVEVNDFNDVKSKLQILISEHVIGKGYSDSDLLFNITSSTAQVTAAMILSALKGDRKAEYIHQNTSKVVPVDVDVLTIQDLWDEIGLRILKNKL